MPNFKPPSGEKIIKILVNEYEFSISGRKGSHVRLSKITPDGKIGTVVPMHKELKTGTLRNIVKLAKIEFDEFAKHL